MDVQAIKKPGKKMKLYGKELSTQQMGVQVSRSIHAKVSKENRLLGDAGGHPRSMQMKRCGDHRRKSHARPYSPAAVDPAKVFRVEFYGYLKWKSAMMIFERHANLKYKFGNRHF